MAATRTLAGSSYDLVERNNNIVMDYQKQELIRLTLPVNIHNDTGMTVNITADVTTKYGGINADSGIFWYRSSSSSYQGWICWEAI